MPSWTSAQPLSESVGRLEENVYLELLTLPLHHNENREAADSARHLFTPSSACSRETKRNVRRRLQTCNQTSGPVVTNFSSDFYNRFSVSLRFCFTTPTRRSKSADYCRTSSSSSSCCCCCCICCCILVAAAPQDVKLSAEIIKRHRVPENTGAGTDCGPLCLAP